MDISLSLPNFPLNQLHGDITAGLGLLKSLGDNASVFIPGIGEPVGPVNRVLWSQDFTRSAWGKQGVSATANAAPAPDGSMTASVLTSTALAREWC